MRNTFLLIYVVVSFVFSGISQEKKGIVANDSLKALLDNSKKSYNRYRIKESLGYAIKAANYAHELNADREIALAYYFITINYSAIADYESSKVYSSKALKYAKLSKQKDLMAGIYNNMGIMYADAYKDLKLSLAYYKKSKDIFCEEDNDGYTIPVINIARTYIFMKDYDKAYPYMEEYKELLNSIIADDVHGKCLLKYLEGQYFTYKNDIQMAKKSYSDAMYLAIGHCFLEEQLLIYEARSEMYESIGDIDNAYQDIKAHKKYQSAFLDKEKLKQIQIAKVGFSVDEYERELEVAKKEKDYQMNIANNNKTITFISIICFILLLGIVFFLL